MFLRNLFPIGRARRARAAVIGVALLPIVFLATSRPAAGSGLEPISVTDGAVVLAYHGDPVDARRGEDGSLLVTDRIQPEGPIGPGVSAPGGSAWIALPPGTRSAARARVIDDVPLPWPADMSAAERARCTAALPAAGASAGAACWVHNQWGQPVSFQPLFVDAAGLLRCVREAEITVPLPGGTAKSWSARPASGRDSFEGGYRDLFANYTQGRLWRRGGFPAAKDARGDGFESTSKPWIKVRVSRRGPYVITGADLRALGLTDVDPVTLRLFRPQPLPLPEDQDWQQAPSWMIEVPVEVRGGGDGTLDPGDQIVFLGQGPDGWYDELGVRTTGPDRYYSDPYDNDVVYWLTWGGTFAGSPKRIQIADGTAVAPPFLTEVTDRVHFEQNEFWEPRAKETAIPPAVPAAWERFWWLSLTASANNPYRSAQVTPLDPVIDRAVRLRIRLWGNSSEFFGSPQSDHIVRVTMNDSLIAHTDRLPNGRFWDGFVRRDIDTTGTWLKTGDQNFGFNLPYRPVQYPDSIYRDTDNVFLAWIEMEYTRRLIARGDTLAFQSGGLLKSEQSFSIAGFTAPEVTVLDATDPFNPVRIQPAVLADGGVITVRYRAEAGGDPPRHFIAWSDAKFLRPRLEVDTPPEGGYLRGRTDPVTMIVITHGDFRTQAEAIADYRRTHFPGAPGEPDPPSVPVDVIDVQDIYDEFSFGRVDPTALRNFLQCARDRYNGGDPDAGPAYVLLVGDPHYDFRNTLGQGARIFVPTYEGCYDNFLVGTAYSPQFGSDDYFAYLDGPADTGLDLNIGRLPVRTPFEAETVVEKVRAYESAAADGPWKGRVTLVADDICQGTKPDVLKFLHMEQTETLPPLLPSALQIDKIYLYEFGTECVYDRKPLAADALRTRINEGTLLVNFTGHGSDSQLADERVFETAGVPGLINADRLFLFFTASCSVGKYDFFGEGLGESMLLHRGGGAISVFSASAIAYSGGNSEMNQKFFQALFPRKSAIDPLPIGAAAVRAKLNLGVPGNINSKRYVMLGDPAVRLAVPHRFVDLSLTEARTGVALGDSLRRGVLTDLHCTVRMADSTTDNTFDGTLQVRVYDSARVRSVPSTLRSYQLLGAPIYRGEVQIGGGSGTLRFQVPAALRTGLRGPAGVYAYAAAPDRDALGSLPLLSVPERAAPPGTDHEGPRIEVHLEGDPTALPPEASFTADLFDSSGVNITGLVASRSVVLQVEENGVPTLVVDLADAVTFGEDYRTARVESRLPAGLVAGRAYEAVLRASDNLGNTASTRVPFTVAGGSGGAFSLDGVYNFPNPTDGGTDFFGGLSAAADLEITIYTISGKRIWRVRQDGVTPLRLAREGIRWDGRDADGDTPANGVYVFRLRATPLGGGGAREVTGRLVVSR